MSVFLKLDPLGASRSVLEGENKWNFNWFSAILRQLE